ncbi:MAG TPA: septum formation protein Maf [Prevotella sp.]|jgi:septum formation protein|uniref:Maf-like protein n=1 Tax=Hallella absiana TaxID=2925336 RepID=UPI000EDDDB1B|nr:Maf-like protein [Hallella absiana]MDD5820882.1 Maf-like protein [Prevotella sp.]HCJ46734.1 septum formation protein Maf [Prevotella sp.]
MNNKKMETKRLKIILASASPRRKELLAGLDLDFEVKVVKGVSESYPKTLRAEEVPQYISREKAAAYQVADDELLLTADTVVIVDNTILGKPHDADDARRMLRLISGRTHQVVTGVTLTTAKAQKTFGVSTDVTFRQLTDDEIDYYIAHYRPFDKAGAYGIQEWIGYVGVTSIHGSYYNVMGLPVQRIYQEIMEIEK